MKLFKAFFLVLLFGGAFGGGLALRSFHDQLAHVAAISERYAAQATSISERLANLPPKPSTYTLLFVGDIMLARGVDYYIQKYGAGDYRYPFLKIADEIRSADFAFGNLENPISDRGKNQGSIYSFRASPKAIEGLTFAGFDALSLANNHIWDWGAEALGDTVGFLEDWGIRGVGAGRNYREANGPAVAELPDGTRIASFAFTNLMPRSLEATETRPGLSQFKPEIMKERIAKLKSSSFAPQSGATEEKRADIVIVLLHWGEEYAGRANQFQKSFARELIDAGADLIIGHHPHVVQEVEHYMSNAKPSESLVPLRSETAEDGAKEGYIAYSLGNFVFDQGFSEATKSGLMLKVVISDKKIQGIEKIPIAISETAQPTIVTKNQ